MTARETDWGLPPVVPPDQREHPGAPPDPGAEHETAGAAQGDEPREVRPEATWQPWSAFRETTPVEPRWLVRGLIPRGGIGVLGSTPKAGKTWLVLHLALCCVAAKPFLGRFVVPEPIGVHLLALEGSRSAIRTRIGALARGLGIDPDGAELERLVIDYKPRGVNLSDPTSAERYCAQVLASGADLAIVDTVRRAARIRESGEGVADLAVLQANLAPLLEAEVHTKLLHHARKVRAGGEWVPPLERLSGSGDWGGIVEVGLLLDRAKGGSWRTAKLEFDGRDTPEYRPVSVLYRIDGEADDEPETARAISYGDALHVRAVEAPADDEAKSKLATEVIQWMRGQRGVSAAEIKTYARVGRGSAWTDLLADLRKRGVTDNAKGTSALRYFAPGEGPDGTP